MRRPTTAYLGLGSNLGDRLAMLCRAREELAGRPGILGVRSSRLYETAPVGGPPGQRDYLNAVLGVEIVLNPAELQACCQEIEAGLGRERGERWAARTLDIDLLLVGDRILDSPELILPHPRLAERRFVLEPLCDLAPGLAHPRLGLSISQLLERLEQPSACVCRGAW